MLTFSEFKNILQLIASDDLECNILGQTLARQCKFAGNDYGNYYILLHNEYYKVLKDKLYTRYGECISYQQAYKKYMTCPYTFNYTQNLESNSCTNVCQTL